MPKSAALQAHDYVFPVGCIRRRTLARSTCACIVDGWVKAIGLDPAGYGTYSVRRTKRTLIDRWTRT